MNHMFLLFNETLGVKESPIKSSKNDRERKPLEGQ